MKDIKVSVLIANYNNEQYLTECIDSIKKQTYQNVEIIIHDDASSDNSIKRINKYKNIKIIKNKKRGSYGSYNQMNAYYKAFKKKLKLLNYFSKEDAYYEFDIRVQKLEDYIVHKNLTRIDFLKIDTEGYEYEILLGLGNKISLVKILMFEHHYDNMIIKNYTFTDINNFLKMNNFNQIYKSKMPFRKTFEYIYKREELIN